MSANMKMRLIKTLKNCAMSVSVADADSTSGAESDARIKLAIA